MKNLKHIILVLVLLWVCCIGYYTNQSHGWATNTNLRWLCQSGGLEAKTSTYVRNNEFTNASVPIKTTLIRGGLCVFVLQNRCSFAAKHVSVARTSAGPAVQTTLCPPRSSSLVATCAAEIKVKNIRQIVKKRLTITYSSFDNCRTSKLPCRSHVLASIIWSGKPTRLSLSLGNTRDSCSSNTFRGCQIEI